MSTRFPISEQLTFVPEPALLAPVPVAVALNDRNANDDANNGSGGGAVCSWI